MLEHLRAIRGDIADMKVDIRDVRHRMTALEIAVASFVGTEASHYASLACRADRADDRLDRIEQRFDLVAS